MSCSFAPAPAVISFPHPANGNTPRAPRPLVPVVKITPREARFLNMLTYMRPHGSQAEIDFVKRFLLPLGVQPDGFGNLWLEILNHDGKESGLLWSSHVDTVHRTDGRQSITYGDGIVSLSDPKLGNCLGADCTSGVFVMCEMIEARIPGRYVFHRGEECGGLGSEYVAKHEPGRLDGIAWAIALDRKGYADVITHQGARTCSDDFAAELSDRLNQGRWILEYKPCDGGVFTDTANYRHLVPECTNLSVGYFGQHGPRETQNLPFLFALSDTLQSINLDDLPVARDVTEPDDYGWQGGGWGEYMDWRYGGATHKTGTLSAVTVASGGATSRYEDKAIEAPRDLENFVYNNPGVVADFLYNCGYCIKELQNFKDEMIDHFGPDNH